MAKLYQHETKSVEANLKMSIHPESIVGKLKLKKLNKTLLELEK